MIETSDPVLAALAASSPPPLPETLAARALARSRAHLAPARPARGRAAPSEPRFAPRLVPALLGAVAVVFAIDTCVQIARIFGRS
jgi:hypothetical protein